MMTDVKWIKLSLKIFDDEKIKLIEAMPELDTILIVWFKLLVLAGKTNDNGYIYLNKNIPYTDEMLATIFNRPLNTVRLSLDIFTKFEMIEYDENGLLYISNWEKHQNIEGMDKIREQNRLRKQKQRENQKLLSENVTSRDSHATEEERRKKREEIRKEKEEVVEVIGENENEKFKTTAADIPNELNNLPCDRDLPILENNAPKAFEFYEENFTKVSGKIKTPQAIAENLIEAIQTMGDDLVLFALQKTLEMGGNRDWAYTKKILAEWYKKGITTVKQAMNEPKAKNKNRKDMTMQEKAEAINWDELEG